MALTRREFLTKTGEAAAFAFVASRLGIKAANTISENGKNGTDIQVLGINGFRGGEV